MKKSRFTETQIVLILNEWDAGTLREIRSQIQVDNPANSTLVE